MSVAPIISARNIKKSFGQTHALRGVSLDIKPGEVLAIMGPSGSGKSTLLHSLAAITNVDEGEILFDGTRIDTMNDKERSILRRTAFGFVFQFGQLVPELSVHDNVALPLLLNGVSRKDAYARAKKWIAAVGLRGKEASLPGEISGGQAQRVAIARAMVIEPKVLFADEPTGSLDSLNSEKVMELFIKTAKENGTTVVMVTHEPTIAAYADREIIVRDGQITTAAGVEPSHSPTTGARAARKTMNTTGGVQ
ncbi:MAG: ABC transporter ATP-binding protein [Candidatus Saccharibacteria bacterium]|nr:ABC transporter ATP-binding protein [Candidatus Saccharibacteria bacterium]